LCGFPFFSRDGTAGTTDVTIDKLLAAAADPNPATPPALAHSIAGTRLWIRSSRGALGYFHNPPQESSFTAELTRWTYQFSRPGSASRH